MSPTSIKHSAGKRRHLVSLEDRGGKIAQALGDLQGEARAYTAAALKTEGYNQEHDRKVLTERLGRSAIRYAKAIERARDER